MCEIEDELKMKYPQNRFDWTVFFCSHWCFRTLGKTFFARVRFKTNWITARIGRDWYWEAHSFWLISWKENKKEVLSGQALPNNCSDYILWAEGVKDVFTLTCYCWLTQNHLYCQQIHQKTIMFAPNISLMLTVFDICYALQHLYQSKFDHLFSLGLNVCVFWIACSKTSFCNTWNCSVHLKCWLKGWTLSTLSKIVLSVFILSHWS